MKKSKIIKRLKKKIIKLENKIATIIILNKVGSLSDSLSNPINRS